MWPPVASYFVWLILTDEPSTGFHDGVLNGFFWSLWGPPLLIWKVELYLDFLFLFSSLSSSHHMRCTSHAMVVRYPNLVSASFRTVTKVAQAQILSKVSSHIVSNSSCGNMRGITGAGSLQIFLCTGLCQCWRPRWLHTHIHSWDQPLLFYSKSSGISIIQLWEREPLLYKEEKITSLQVP